ncbi:E3 ubiquitin-protein ligase TRAIP-like [Haliotis asinina]|uniref:E3 ubiquitin-protein ligase TRAIP-like n=1 Tax=Haliotis asinina TaxID=109174 RepID=UPI003531B43D
MRAQCCICADLFENDDNINIAAVPCGHTFHEECVMKWVESSNSCPQCRKYVNKKQVIRKLYFDAGDEPNEKEKDPDKLQNELMTLRSKLKQRDREKAELESSKDLLRKNVRDIEESKSAIQKLLKQEEGTSSSLRKQLAYFESQQKALKTERESYKRAQAKLAAMQHVEGLLSGCESDAESILEQYGEGKSASRQLAHFCSIMKREYEQAKTEKRLLKDQLDKVRRELCTKTRLLSECSKELQTLRDHFTQSEEDLKHAEQDKERMKKKIHHLKRAIKSPDCASSSFVATLTEDSPAFITPVKPGLQGSKDGVIDLENTPDPKLALTPDLFKDTPTTEAKKHCVENNMKFVKISTASTQNPAKRPRNESNDPNHLTALGSLNIFKKKQGPCYPSVSRKGYDGLGGHTTFTQGLGGKPKFAVRKTKPTLSKRKDCQQPDLPSLGNFLE